MKNHLLIIPLFYFSITALYFGQTSNEDILLNRGTTPQLISFSKGSSLSDVIENIDLIARENENRKIFYEGNLNTRLGFEIKNLTYTNALFLIAEKYNHELIINDSSYILRTKTNLVPSVLENEDSLVLNTKQIEVAALLFDLNIHELRERGINWQAILSKHGLVLGSDLKTFTPNSNMDYNLNLQLEGDIGVFSGYTNALFRFLEDQNLGKIAARLSVTCRNGQQGRMQVGSDFSIKQRDFAGNVMDAFYPTGTIIEILPKIYSIDTLQFALLKVNVERSMAFPDAISTEVRKTNANSEIIMRDNEEAVVGGLLYTEQIKVRTGIPGLKDLPWWVLGLRYLTGYDRTENIQREVLMFLKIKIIPSLNERLRL